MTRRDLAKLAAGAAMAPQARLRAATYSGALDEAKVALNNFDPVAFSRHLYESAPLRLTFRAQTRKQAEAWQKKLHAKLIELLGPFPASSPSLNSQTLEVREFPSYRREKFIFESSPGLHVLGYLLTPSNAKPPYATVVSAPGHGRGVDDIIGVDENGRDRINKDGYQHDVAIQVTEHDTAAVAIEPIAFGCRRDPLTRKKGLKQSACQPVAGAALLLGQTMIGWRVHDVSPPIDCLGTPQTPHLSRLRTRGTSRCRTP